MSLPKKKATRAHTRIHNTRLVLKTIYDREPISRAAIARVTQLTRPTVSDAVARLAADGLVVDVGQGPSTGGRKPRLLSVVTEARSIIGIDLAGNAFRGGVVDLRGSILHRQQLVANGLSGEAALQQVYALIDDLMSQASSPLLGIGIASPGLIDTQKGMVRRAINLGWEDVPLQDLLLQRYPEPIYIANDSHVTALADYTFGEPGTSPNRIVLKVGRGIGAGIVVHGNLYYGDGYSAGEIGHVVVAENGELCACGNYGCLETIASTSAILRQAQAIAETQPDSDLASTPTLDWDSLVAAFAADDSATTALITRVGQSLGIAVANLIAAFNIHQILISGRVAAFGEVLLQAIQSEARRRVLPSMAAETNISFTTIGADIGILGSAAMLLKNELGII